MVGLELIKSLWEFALENSDIAIALTTAALGGTGWLGKRSWQRFRRKKRQIAAVDTFPFEVLRPGSTDVVQRIYGSALQTTADPLADFNISYQQRLSARDIQQELLEKITRKWLLILGPTGLGKTREAAEIAQALCLGGWTVMRLKNRELLTVPDSFPVDRLERQPKLLFVLDNLNEAMVAGQQLPAVDEAGVKTAPMKSAMQTRLLDTLKYYMENCSADRVRVIATARNEQERLVADIPSEWEKLEIEKYGDFWERFEHCELPPPENRAIAQLLETCTKAAGIAVESDLEKIAQTNDRTFRNPVENLERLKNREEALSLASFKPTLQGNWQSRYQAVREQYGEVIAHLYTGIDLLRQVKVALAEESVVTAAQIVSNRSQWLRWWERRKLRQILRRLEKTERILEPRDGQIEANPAKPELGRYLAALCQQLPKTFEEATAIGSTLGLAIAANDHQLYSVALEFVNWVMSKLSVEPSTIESKAALLGFRGNILGDLKRHEEALAAYNLALEIKPNHDYYEVYNRGVTLSALDRHEEALAAYNLALKIKPNLSQAIYNKSLALRDLGRHEEAISASNRALQIKPDDHQVLNNKGLALSALGRHEEAITAYDLALKIKPDLHQVLNNKGIVLSALGRNEEAIEAYDHALKIKPNYPSAWYNKACDYALLKDSSKAITYLKKAIALEDGNECVELAATDTDFDAIRTHPDFQALITNKQ